MIRIGITINDVLRNFSGKFFDVYDHDYPEKNIELDIDPYNLSKYFENITEKKYIDITTGEEVKSNSIETAANFVYSEAVMELFGFADECYKNCIIELNRIADIMKEEGFELIIVSDEIGKTRAATLHFLSKSLCQLQKIIFVDSFDEFFQHCDLLITTNYTMFDKYGDKIIKIERKYNENYNNTLFSLKEIKYLPTLIEKLKIKELN